MKYAAYNEYKPSRIEWLGEVPAHWAVTRSDGLISSERRQVQPETFLAEDVFHYSIPAVQEYGTGLVEDGESIKSAKQPVLRESLLVSKLNPRKATIVVAEPQGNLRTLCSTEFVTLFADKCDLGFLTYVTLSEAFRQRLDAAVQSVTRSHQRANPRDIYSFWNAWPPLDEQQTIARLLDAKTAQIDALVARKRQLIDKLKEKRQALIARTVTRGLPPEAAKAAGLEPYPEMKDSGVEWLGEIPAVWKPLPLGYLVKMRGGATPDKGRPEYWDGEIPWVSPKDMKVANIFDAEDHISDEGLHNSPLSLIPKGALLIVVRGMILAHSFPVALSMRELTINQDMKALVCSRSVQPEYLYWALCGFSAALVALADESAHGTKKIDSTTLARFPVLVPPLAEQQTIAAYLDHETSRTDQLVAKVEAAVTRLTEYRQALITSAVTGKIDVRGFTPEPCSGGLRHAPAALS